MPHRIDEHLRASVVEALNMMCQVALHPETSAHETGTTHGARIKFWGGSSGEMVMTVGDTLLEVLSVNFLKLDESPSAEDKEGFLKELLNIVCGNAMPLIFPTPETIHLGSPELISVAPSRIRTYVACGCGDIGIGFDSPFLHDRK